MPNGTSSPAPDGVGPLAGTCFNTDYWVDQASHQDFLSPLPAGANMSCAFDLEYNGYHHNATNTSSAYVVNMTYIDVSAPFVRLGTANVLSTEVPGPYSWIEFCGLYFRTPIAGGTYSVTFNVYYTWHYLAS
jgi:hypothetical protein